MQQKEDENKTVDAFSFVMGSEHPGRLRLYGRGVKKLLLIGKLQPYQMKQMNS